MTPFPYERPETAQVMAITTTDPLHGHEDVDSSAEKNSFRLYLPPYFQHHPHSHHQRSHLQNYREIHRYRAHSHTHNRWATAAALTSLPCTDHHRRSGRGCVPVSQSQQQQQQQQYPVLRSKFIATMATAAAITSRSVRFPAPDQTTPSVVHVQPSQQKHKRQQQQRKNDGQKEPPSRSTFHFHRTSLREDTSLAPSSNTTILVNSPSSAFSIPLAPAGRGHLLPRIDTSIPRAILDSFDHKAPSFASCDDTPRHSSADNPLSDLSISHNPTAAATTTTPAPAAAQEAATSRTQPFSISISIVRPASPTIQTQECDRELVDACADQSHSSGLSLGTHKSPQHSLEYYTSPRAASTVPVPLFTEVKVSYPATSTHALPPSSYRHNDIQSRQRPRSQPQTLLTNPRRTDMGSNPQGATSSITHELDDLFQSSSTESSSPKFTFHIEEEIFVISDDQDDDPDGSSAAPTLPTPLIWSSTLQVPSATVQEQRVQFRPGHRRSRQTVTLDLREVSAISSDTFRDSSLSSGSDMSPTSSSGTSPRPSRSRIPIRSHLVAASTPVPAPAPEQSSQSSSAPPSPIDRITAHYSTPRDRILHPRPLNFHVYVPYSDMTRSSASSSPSLFTARPLQQDTSIPRTAFRAGAAISQAAIESPLASPSSPGRSRIKTLSYSPARSTTPTAPDEALSAQESSLHLLPTSSRSALSSSLRSSTERSLPHIHSRTVEKAATMRAECITCSPLSPGRPHRSSHDQQQDNIPLPPTIEMPPFPTAQIQSCPPVAVLPVFQHLAHHQLSSSSSSSSQSEVGESVASQSSDAYRPSPALSGPPSVVSPLIQRPYLDRRQHIQEQEPKKQKYRQEEQQKQGLDQPSSSVSLVEALGVVTDTDSEGDDEVDQRHSQSAYKGQGHATPLQTSFSIPNFDPCARPISTEFVTSASFARASRPFSFRHRHRNERQLYSSLGFSIPSGRRSVLTAVMGVSSLPLYIAVPSFAPSFRLPMSSQSTAGSMDTVRTASNEGEHMLLGELESLQSQPQQGHWEDLATTIVAQGWDRDSGTAVVDHRSGIGGSGIAWPETRSSADRASRTIDQEEEQPRRKMSFKHRIKDRLSWRSKKKKPEQ